MIKAIMILAAMLWKIERLDRMSALGLSLIFASGAVSQRWHDRVRAGAVTDFLRFLCAHAPALSISFNVADSRNLRGRGSCFCWSMLKTRESKETQGLSHVSPAIPDRKLFPADLRRAGSHRVPDRALKNNFPVR